MTASRARYGGSSGMASSGPYSRGTKNRGPPGSVRLHDEPPAWKTNDSASDTGLVEGGPGTTTGGGGGITITRGWSQNWHSERDEKPKGEETGHELDTMGRL